MTDNAQLPPASPDTPNSTLSSKGNAANAFDDGLRRAAEIVSNRAKWWWRNRAVIIGDEWSFAGDLETLSEDILAELTTAPEEKALATPEPKPKWAPTHIFNERPVQLVSACSIYSPEGNMWTTAFIYETEDGFKIAVPARIWYRESYKLRDNE